jgi:hypothetical protein
MQITAAQQFYNKTRFYLKAVEMLNRQKDILEKQLFDFAKTAAVHVSF